MERNRKVGLSNAVLVVVVGMSVFGLIYVLSIGRVMDIQQYSSLKDQIRFTRRTKQATAENIVQFMPLQKENLSLAIMHVGKTGGTTLGSNLFLVGCATKLNPKQRDICFKEFYGTGVPESALSRHTKVIVHATKVAPRQETKSINGFIFTAREPISRLESSYYFNSPLHCVIPSKRPFSASQKECFDRKKMFNNEQSFRQFYEYFPTLEKLADELRIKHRNDTITKSTGDINTTTTSSADVLKKYFQHIGLTVYGHATMGYRHYERLAKTMNPNSNYDNSTNVFVIRTSSIWQDTERIDLMLGGTGNFSYLYNAKVDHIDKADRVNQTKLIDGSPEIVNVCCALLPEIQAYRRIVGRAMNLDAQEKIDYYNMTWKRCGVSSWEMLEDNCALIPLSIDS